MLEINEYKVEADDIYLLCSDGLSDMVDDAVIASILLAQQPLVQCAEALIKAANAGGGRDNISVLLAKAEGGIRKRSLVSWLLGG